MLAHLVDGACGHLELGLQKKQTDNKARWNSGPIQAMIGCLQPRKK